MAPRARALLAYLALHPGSPHTRQQLAFRLWPDSTEGQARTNLRNLVHHLRRANPELDALIEVLPSTLRWIGGPRCGVDAQEFLAAIEAAGAAESGSPDHVSALRAARDLYTGDLLGGTDEEWLEEDQAGLREHSLAALRELSDSLARGREPAEAVRAARELVRRESLREDHHRLLIAAHVAAGDRAGAVRAWHDCVELLRSELGVDPSAATQAAYARLLEAAERAEPSPASTPITGVALEGPASAAPLVGRDGAWAELTSRWADAETGRAQLVLVTGEPGVGKTRLVEELATWCARRGALIARSRAYASEGELAYGGVVEWLRSPNLSSTLTALGADDRRQLTRLVPELGPAERSASVSDADRILMFDAVARAVTAHGRPVVLVADDAHWSDGSTVQVLHYLVRTAAEVPLLVVATARLEDLDDRHPLLALHADLQALGRSSALHLDRLGPSDTSALAASLIGTDLAGPIGQTLYAETEGNPLFVVEAIRAGWDGADSADELSLTPRLQSLINRRLQSLTPAARQLVDVAATVGRGFSTDVIGRAAGLEDLGLVRGLDELWRRGVIRSHGADGYDFAHGKIRDVAYEGISPAGRAHHHLRVAEALAANSPSPEEASAQIATHYERAGRPDEATEWLARAAAHAVRLGAHNEALELIEHGLALLDALTGDNASRHELKLLSLLPPTLGAIDGWGSIRLTSVHERAQALASSFGAEVEPPLLRSAVMASLCRDAYDEAGRAAQRLLASAHDNDDEGLLIESTYLLGITAFWSGRPAVAAKHFASVASTFDRASHPDHVVRFGHDPKVVCLSRLANTLWFLGQPEEARRTREDALALAAEVDDHVSAPTAIVFGAMLALDLEDPEAFIRIIAPFDGRERSGAFQVKGEALLGYAEVLQGRADAGLARISTALDCCEGRNLAPGFRAAIVRLLLGAYVATGDSAGGLTVATQALELGGTPLWEPEIRRRRAEFLSALGAPDAEVDAELDRAAVVATRQGSLGPAGAVAETRARLEAKRSRNAPIPTMPA